MHDTVETLSRLVSIESCAVRHGVSLWVRNKQSANDLARYFLYRKGGERKRKTSDLVTKAVLTEGVARLLRSCAPGSEAPGSFVPRGLRISDRQTGLSYGPRGGLAC